MIEPKKYFKLTARDIDGEMAEENICEGHLNMLRVDLAPAIRENRLLIGIVPTIIKRCQRCLQETKK